MGKTSLAKYIQYWLEKNREMIGLYVSNKGNHDLETLINSIIESLLNKIPKSSIDKIKDFFNDRVDTISIKGTGVKFKPSKDLSNNLLTNFPYILNDLIKELPSNNGVLLIIDDINGLSESKRFVDWYKRFADTVSVDNTLNLPLYVLFAGYPEKFDNFVREEESFGRIFHYDNIDVLEPSDVKEFFKDRFAEVDMVIDTDALELITVFSSGLPLMMQQIGDSIFWLSETGHISKELCLNGLKISIDEISRKQLRPVLDQVRSENYEPILLRLGELQALEFKRSNIEKKLVKSQQKVFKNFLPCMVNLGILESVGRQNSGRYKLNNVLYFTYFSIKAELRK